jgi:hypothetical protein
MAKNFTEKQREILARRLGYNGPMERFEDFVRSDPALERKYSAVVQKLQKGGYVQKFQTGGTPTAPDEPTVTASQIAQPTTTSGQLVTATSAPTTATTVTAAPAPTTTTATQEQQKAAAQVTAVTGAPAVGNELKDLEAAQGTISPQAQVAAQTMEPTSTAVGQLQAAEMEARKVEDAPTREIVSGELIEGPAVNQAQVDAALARNEAAQGIVTEDMTIQGQLARLTTDFELKNPPAWAAGAMRNVTAQLAQRGLGASSLAGQALIQATLEAALPIAAQDAQVYRDMGIQNLSNKQQMAVLTAQQRAQFLGQEFDQAFQTRAINAATISQIANINFEAKQQIALENARMAQTADLANLNNRQALVMATAAQIATLETANLNNRQQAAVVNAQAFLQMDLTNLNNRQQTALFKSQEMINAIMSDTAAQNAARQFNASSVNQVNQFYDSLSSQVKQFNAAQTNAMAQFNVEQRNAIGQFNANVQNQRDQFNAENRRIIDQSNAEWRRNIATANTAAINRANEFNATSALQVTMAEYNNLWQKYRDDIEYSWKTGENELDRENELAKQVLQKQATIEAAQFQVEAAKYSALGTLAATLLDKSGGAATVGAIISGAASAIWGAAGSMGASIISGFKTVRTKLAEGANPDTLPKFTGPVTGTVKVQIPLPFGGTETKSFSNEYLDFIADTYKQPKGTQIHAMLAEQDSWFYD